MITIDGSDGEGGGQVLRTALALSLATQQPCRIDNIRARRKKPGLLRQHLTAVQAATAVGRAHVEGDVIGSRSLTFEPRGIEGGEYAFSVGTAGSATLVFQTIMLPLLQAGAPSTLTFEGGTHNPWAPPFDFVDRVYLPIVRRMGGRVETSLERHGFYPAGGGRFTVSIAPGGPLTQLTLQDRGEISTRRVRALVANLPLHIAEREVKTALRLLNWSDDCGRVEAISGAIGPGNIVFVEMESPCAVEILAGFGDSGVAAEAVADRAVRDARRYLAANVPVGACLADQLLPLLAAGQGGSFRTLALTPHARTNIDVIRRFIDVRVNAVEEARDVVRIEMERMGRS